MNTPLTLLGGLSPTQFLAEYWQKKPLLIRQAIPGFGKLLNPNELAGLACEEDVQSRLIQYKKGQWLLRNGPFDEEDFAKLPEKNWTLLVQSVNHHLAEACDLLAQFNFIPHARLDDLMVSYAPDGGGVGPHFDSYDVFLLQGIGQRKWQISAQQDLCLIEGAPLKILQSFTPEQEWVLEAGDMLYLPPHYAHCGTAVNGDCMTYSIGFRAPRAQELQHEFMSYLQDNLPEGVLYTDPDLTLQTHPAEISSAMIDKVADTLTQIRWNKAQVADFLGRYLTEPKPDVFFEPHKPIALNEFGKRLRKKSLRLDLKSQLLFQQALFYLNGESLVVPSSLQTLICELADHRKLNTPTLDDNTCYAVAECLYEAYIAGYLYME